MNALDLSALNKFSDLMKPGTKTPSEPNAAGTPLDLPLDMIDEDPDQPRKAFDPDALQELADSISARRVIQAIKVRPHPTIHGRYIINEGARRYRASLLAGKASIPAVVDADHEYIDQLIENVQRAGLTVRETIDSVSRLLAEGMKQKDIATKTGMSKAWVSKFAGLRELPPPLAAALVDGRCRDSDALVTLKQCWDADEQVTTGFLNLTREPGEFITKRDADVLRANLLRAAREDQGGGDNGSSEEDPAQKKERASNPDQLKHPVIQVLVEGRPAFLRPARAAKYGSLWIEYEDGNAALMAAAKVQLVAVVDGKSSPASAKAKPDQP